MHPKKWETIQNWPRVAPCPSPITLSHSLLSPRNGGKPIQQRVKNRQKQWKTRVQRQALVPVPQQMHKCPPWGAITHTQHARALTQNVVPPPPRHLLATETALPTWLCMCDDSWTCCTVDGGHPKQLCKACNSGYRALLQPAGPVVHHDNGAPSCGGAPHQCVVGP